MRLSPTYDSDWPTVLLVVTIAGVTYRYADRGPVSLTYVSGNLLFSDGLEGIQVADVIDLWGTTASKNVSVAVRLGTGLDLPTLYATGRQMYSATARLYVSMSSAFEDAVLLASGRVADPIYGDPSAPDLLSFSIERDLVDRAIIPSRVNYLREDSWDSLGGVAYEDHDGLPRQILIGRPGMDGRSTGGVIKTTPVNIGRVASFAVPDQSRYEIAGHHVVATIAKVWSATNYSSGVCDILYATDELGHGVSYLDLTTYTGTVADLLDDLPAFAGFDSETHPGITGVGFRGLGDVVVWALSQTSFAATNVDWPRVHGMTDALNGLGRVDTWISEWISPYEWLVSQVLAYFPVFVADSGNGLYVGLWRFDAADGDVSFSIDPAIPGYNRVTPLSWSQPELANDITLSSQYSAATGKYHRFLRLVGDEGVVDPETGTGSRTDVPLQRHPLFAESYQTFGAASQVVELPTIQDPTTLGRIGQYMAYKLALPRAEVGYSIPWRAGIPEVGEVCRVLDPDIGLPNARGIVTAVDMQDGSCSVRVSLITTT